MIPACAGFTRRAVWRSRARTDHPRSRGVYVAPLAAVDQWAGSSPLARGLHHRRDHRGHARRIIPARAGFTVRQPWRSPARPDHPRSRGVYAGLNIPAIWADGSSPLARGLRSSGGIIAKGAGIIPARAGFTSTVRPPRCRRPDHPRSRGVYYRAKQLGGPQWWIIPARAGFTRAATGPPSLAGDHPRSRGVYKVTEGTGYVNPGSSPLARGLPGVCEGKGWQPGIIPARAGFTWPGHARHGYPPDHPRSRGVYKEVIYCIDVKSGSSPLARGLRQIPSSLPAS